MKIGIMCGFKLLLWILLVRVLNARHVPLARQRNSAQSRPRLLVIRPPEGSGQPNRIVVLANQRPQPTNASPTLSTAISALQETAAVAQANLNRAFGGHPQSAFRHQTSSSSLSSSSSSSTSNSGTSGSSTSTSTGNGGTRSIRNLIQGLRRAAPTSSSNIARVSDTIPRAMPPVLPPATRFGELNIPSVIEAALRRLQERARLQGNVRDNNVLHRHDFRPSHTTPKQTERAPFSGGVIDLSRVSINDRNNRNDVTSGGTGRTNTNPRWDIGTVLSTSTLGRNGVSPLENVWDQSGVGTTVKEVGTGFNANDILQMPADKRSMPSSSVGRTGSNLRTFQDKSLDALGSQTNGISAAPTLDIQTLLSDSLTQTNPVLPSQGSQGIGTDLQLDVNNHRGSASFQIGNQPPSPQSSFDSMIPAPSRIDQFLPPSPPVTNPMNVIANAKNNSLPTPVMSLNASAKVSASSAESNSTSNTTSTKSVKTKTIKVTTVVKGGNQADVAAAAASQAELANAVAQGKEINSSALAGLAKAAAGVKSPKINPKNNPPAGSITVKRQPNGDSIITLSDGQGEPVILRASGPVKIERIIKPNGRIQFLINPVEKATTTTTATPETTAELEIEPEDITTTVSAPTAAGISLLGFTNTPWTTEPPFYSDTVPGRTNAAQGVKEAKVEKTIQITDTAVSNSASSAVNTSVKNETSSARIQQDLIKLFKPPGIPRPPKVSDMNFGNAGLSDPFLNGISSILRAHAKNIPPPSDVSMVGNVHTSTTTLSALPTDKSITPLNLFPGAVDRKLLQSQSKHTTVVTETMPQYNLLGVSPSLTFVPKGKSAP